MTVFNFAINGDLKFKLNFLVQRVDKVRRNKFNISGTVGFVVYFSHTMIAYINDGHISGFRINDFCLKRILKCHIHTYIKMCATKTFQISMKIQERLLLIHLYVDWFLCIPTLRIIRTCVLSIDECRYV